MKQIFVTLLGISCLSMPLAANADNALSTSQLLQALQVATADYVAADPEMSKSISGLKTVTTGTNAIVSIEMNSDGMKMTAKYLCVPRSSEMACRLQQ